MYRFIKIKRTGTAFLFGLCVLWIFWSCDVNTPKEQKLFKLLDSNKTGITFNNALEETNEMNVLVYQDFYSGGGVSIGDIDNDGLSDVFLTGNQVPSRLYKNLGDMVFEDITSKVGLNHMGRGWYTGTSMIDINNDGFLDIYISKSGMEARDDRANLLYINNGDGSFTEKAKEFGLDHQGFGVNAAFLDFDKDGDLDMYLVNQGPVKLTSGDANKLRSERHPEAGDVLYENVDGKFIDVTESAGLYSSVIGFAHGVSVGDVNDDGWDDIFVSNDFFEYDYLYINNQDKTFTESIKKTMKHISYYSMGNDMADFNNDGLPDIAVVDMVAEGNRRLYSNLGGMNKRKFENHLEKGLYYQYMFNVLHMNNGNETFSDVGGIAGISKTDWSWAPLFVDLDNNGWKDLYVTNGIRKDVRNIDWGILYREMVKLSGGQHIFSDSHWDMLLSTMPSEPVSNYAFKNNGNLVFDQAMDEWGLDQESWSNGVAFGDLDNDGDLELVVNNIDQEAFVYENTQKHKNFLRFKFRGSSKNPMGLGTKVRLIYGDQLQYQQHFLARGYRSSMEPIMHFGLGLDSLVNRVEVVWPDGKMAIYHEVASNQVIQFDYVDAEEMPIESKSESSAYFKEVTDELNIPIRHSENELDDFMREPMLPYKQSTLGPALAIGDVNGDGLDDIYLGGAFRRSGQLLIQNNTLEFVAQQPSLWQSERMFEDVGAVFFDFDGDADLDLYVVSGGNENTAENQGLQDRLYINDGQGRFSKSIGVLGSISCSGSVAIPNDFDEDGDLDLFVGGRLVPAQFPTSADSYLLENQDGKLVDVTNLKAPELRKLGMVTDAVWSDYDVDGDMDLVVVGEWMPITIFSNDLGKLHKIINTKNGLEYSSGWWWSIIADDFDKDGDPDFVVGNMGLNTTFKVANEYPIEVFVDDFDEDNYIDLVIGYYQNGDLYSMNSRAKLIMQNPYLKDIIKTNNDFSTSTLYDIYGKEKLEAAQNIKIYTLATSYVKNNRSEGFEIQALDACVQISNTNSIIAQDLNHDGNTDLIMAGNLYAMETETIRNDAGIGNVLLGNGEGSFEILPFSESGLYIPGDLRQLALINSNKNPYLICAKNSDYVQVFQLSNPK